MSATEIRVGGRVIGAGHPPLIVAEMSGNHNQSLERALQIVAAAAAAGAHAVKLQTYTADTMTLDVDAPGFRIEDEKSLWNGRRLYDLYAEAHTPWDWHPPILERCRALGMVGFSTPFDDTSVDFLETLGVPLYKIASFEMTDPALIRRAAGTGKPLIVSTGMASAEEIEESVATARAAGCAELVLLKCTSTYPSDPGDSDLRTIPDLRERTGCQVGLSDHTLGIGAAVAAVALGATVIEKHFTLSRADGGVDAAFSLEPHELKALVEETSRAWRALGRVRYGPTERERSSLKFRRSLYVSRRVRAGEALSPENVRAVRPGFGLAPKHLDAVLGRRARRDLEAGTPLAWDQLED